MIKAMIIDDENHSIKSLENDLKMNCPFVTILARCNNAKEGIGMIKKIHPELVFLDVEMPWMNGFEMLELFDTIDFSIIFITAHDQYAAKAFRISAIDYLLKPVAAEDLIAAVNKFEVGKRRSKEDNIGNLLENMRRPAAQQKIALANKDGYQFVELNQIVYCEAAGAYTKVFLLEKRHILVSKTLGDIEELLPTELFQRIHNSTIININYITHFIKSDGGYIKLSTGEELAVSKSRREAILERLGLK